MKKGTVFILLWLLLFFFACQKESKPVSDESLREEAGTELEERTSENSEEVLDVTITRELLDRYIATLPPFARKLEELGNSIDTPPEALLANEQIESLLLGHGWKNPEEFFKLHTKIVILTPWIMIAKEMEGQPEAMREMLEKQFEALFDSQEITEEEKQLLREYQGELKAVMDEIG
jgi:hypothetical protein